MKSSSLRFFLMAMMVLLFNSGCKVLVEPVDPYAPTAYSFSTSTYEEEPFTDYLDGQPTKGGYLVYEIVDYPLRGSISGFNSDSGYFTYRPSPNFSGSDYFTYRVWEDGLYSEIAVVTIEVRPTNDRPTAANLIIRTSEDYPQSGRMVGSDSDGDRLSYSVRTYPRKGTVSYDSVTGAYTYSPYPNEYGSDSFTYVVNDGQISSREAMVSVELDSVNDAPVARPTSFGVNNGYCYFGVLTSTDIDSTSRSYFMVSQPTKGSVTLDAVTGAFSYCADTQSSGTDYFSFRAYDGTDFSGPANVTVNINYNQLLRAVKTNFAPSRKKPIAPKN